MNKLCVSISVSILTVLSLARPQAAFGLELDPEALRGKSTKQPVAVLHNRYFVKQHRPEVGFIAGTVLDEAYLDTRAYGLRVGFFFNEWAGIEVQTIQMRFEDSEDRRALRQLQYRPLSEEVVVSPDPEVNPLQSVYDVNGVVAPFYGKLNLLNKMVVYSDVYGLVGTSRVSTVNGSKQAFTIGAGQRFYFSDSWSLRFDVRDRMFSDKRGGEDYLRHAITFDVGASFFFL